MITEIVANPVYESGIQCVPAYRQGFVSVYCRKENIND